MTIFWICGVAPNVRFCVAVPAGADGLWTPRTNRVKVSPDQLDRGIEFYKMTILPALEELEGFCSASLLVDRASGRGVAAATFDNAEAVERNKEALDGMRATGSQEVNADVLDQCDFELALAHLRVPELV